MADRETERLILGQDVTAGPGDVRRLSLIIDHRVVDPERAAARGIGFGDRLLGDLWALVRRTIDESALQRLATEDDSPSAAAGQLRGPVGETLERHGSALVDLSLVADPGDQRDPLTDVARARADSAADAVELMALGVVTHTRFDAAGEAAT